MGYDRIARKRLLRGAGLMLVACGYVRLARPRMARWGATDGEVAGAMPGDGEVPGPQFAVARAVTIAAPPEAVRPWIVQIGYHRAGWYAYDLFDNDDIPSAEAIVPEFQHLEIGQVIGEEGFAVRELGPGTWSWRSSTRRRSGWSSRAPCRSSATARCACNSGRFTAASAPCCCTGSGSPRLRWAAPSWLPSSSRLTLSRAARC